MAVTLQPLGPLTHVPVSGEYRVDDVVLCSDTVAYVLSSYYVWDDVLNRPLSNHVRVFTVNPSTGALLSNRLLDLPIGFIFDLGQWKRLDDTTACFAGWDYPGFRLGTGEVVFGTLHPTGDLITHYHVPDTTTPEHFKDTGQILWVNTAERTGAIMHFPIYHFETVGFERYFHTTATATSLNFDTGAAHHFTVTQNMGPDSDRTAWPQYYGTVPLPDGRVLAGRWYWDGPQDLGRSSVVGSDMIDQNDRVIDAIRAAEFGGFYFDGGFLFQVDGTTDMIYVFVISYDDRTTPDRIYAQRYSTEPDIAPVGGRTLISADADERHYPGIDPYQLIIGSFIDSMDPFGGNLRVLNLPYLNNRNRAGPQSIYIGAQSSRDGTYTFATIDMPYPNERPLYWTTIDTPTSLLGAGRAVLVLFAFNWQYPPDGSHDAVWFQLWATSTEGPPVRLNQRNDGLGVSRHARLEGRGSGSSSQQTGRAPRVNRNNTYS